LKKLLSIIACLSLVSCGGGGGNEPTSSTPVSTTTPTTTTDPSPTTTPTEPVVAPPQTEPYEPPITTPVSADPTPPVVENPPTTDTNTQPIAPNRTTATPAPPAGRFSIYRSELTNSPTPWNELIGSFSTLEEADARFHDDNDPLMYGEGYQYLIMTGTPNDIYSYSWTCNCIPRNSVN
jgi:hypothetical protein